MDDERRRRRCEAAQALAAFLRKRSPRPVELDRVQIETSNDIALRDAEW